MLALIIDKMTHALRMVELTLCKAALLVANLATANLLDELICVGI